MNLTVSCQAITPAENLYGLAIRDNNTLHIQPFLRNIYSAITSSDIIVTIEYARNFSLTPSQKWQRINDTIIVSSTRDCDTKINLTCKQLEIRIIFYDLIYGIAGKIVTEYFSFSVCSKRLFFSIMFLYCMMFSIQFFFRFRLIFLMKTFSHSFGIHRNQSNWNVLLLIQREWHLW